MVCMDVISTFPVAKQPIIELNSLKLFQWTSLAPFSKTSFTFDIDNSQHKKIEQK